MRQGLSGSPTGPPPHCHRPRCFRAGSTPRPASDASRPARLEREVTDAWQDRAAALSRYRLRLPDDTSLGETLESLFHMHHNRMLGLDRPGEGICRRVARQAARAWQANR
ncbi:lantibiotic dehydratase C-terminal domain-containing protein [Streptomyces sp. M10(2022)]